MSAFERVVDYMKGAADAANHHERYFMTFMERNKTSREVQIDGSDLEKKMLGPGERNVIRELMTQFKFTRNRFESGFNLKTIATGRNNKTNDPVIREVTTLLDFKGKGEWWLVPSTSDVQYSNQTSTLHVMSEVERRQIVARCNTMSGDQSDQLAMVTVYEKLCTQMDMRHLFMKLYLLLMDYNLAVTSKTSEMEKAGHLSLRHYPNADHMTRIAAVLNHDCVVDADGFTPEELGLLALGAKEYPSVRYCGDNIYTQILMEEDDLIIISEKDIVMDDSFKWGSPDRLYALIWSLACKLDCVGCLTEAFSTMRGKAKMGDDLMNKVSHNVIQAMVPRSRNLSRAFTISHKHILARAPGYFSTSMSLISDLLFGMMYEASATCVVEELGGIGRALSSKTPDTSRTFNSLLRDHGLEHGDTTINILLKNWYSLSVGALTWGFGKMLKEYCVKLAGLIANGADIILPQIVHLIPYTHTPHSAWGFSRGWTGISDAITATKDQMYEDRKRLAAVAWMMGARSCRPKVFRNIGDKKELTLSIDEFKLAAESANGCKLESIRFFLGDDVGGRVDENEKTASILSKTDYAGTKCSLVYDSGTSRWKLEEDLQYAKMTRESLRGERQIKEDMGNIRPVTFGGAKPQLGDPFSHLKNLSRVNQIRVEKEPRHIRANSTGEAYVAPYELENEMSSTPLHFNYEPYSDEEQIQVKEINVPGDGSCGIHAVMEDLKSHGYVAPSEVKKAEEVFSDESRADRFHDAQEIAALAQKWGFGLDVYDRDTEILHRFGDGSQRHTITLIKRGEHFNAGIIKRGGESVIKKVIKQSITSEEYIKKINDFGNLFA